MYDLKHQMTTYQETIDSISNVLGAMIASGRYDDEYLLSARDWLLENHRAIRDMLDEIQNTPAVDWNDTARFRWILGDCDVLYKASVFALNRVVLD